MDPMPHPYAHALQGEVVLGRHYAAAMPELEPREARRHVPARFDLGTKSDVFNLKLALKEHTHTEPHSKSCFCCSPPWGIFSVQAAGQCPGPSPKQLQAYLWRSRLLPGLGWKAYLRSWASFSMEARERRQDFIREVLYWQWCMREILMLRVVQSRVSSRVGDELTNHVKRFCGDGLTVCEALLVQ